ncbi:hypothetical protein AERO8C_140165 [Aeromonas veronii]|uniref:Uncharacterized protein n=1 Tax=Aeromonas veronii TaxID=654 RepID=A0A653KVZ3_AERVE|nr:hypothetical protein AERO8C_140165 [Aeromonas veronii]
MEQGPITSSRRSSSPCRIWRACWRLRAIWRASRAGQGLAFNISSGVGNVARGEAFRSEVNMSDPDENGNLHALCCPVGIFPLFSWLTERGHGPALCYIGLVYLRSGLSR